MSDDPNPTKSELILSRNRSLVIKKSGLVKRGLELVHELRKRKVQVLIGDHQDNIGMLIFEWIKEEISDEYDLKAITTPIANELLELAQNNEFDIFILILNNIKGFPSENLHGVKRVVNVLQLATHLKTAHRRPVVALSGQPDEPTFSEEKAKLSGADFYFPIPCKMKDFMEAIKEILGHTP